jgi:prepilin-type N-terminal cleavage/methylation domain-containing protein
MARAMAMTLAAVFMIAAGWKGYESAHVRDVLTFLGVVPSTNHPAAAGIVAALVGLEVFLAISLMVFGPHRALLAALVGVLLVYSLALVVLALRENSPPCGCLPDWMASGSGQREAMAGLVRNAGLIGMCAFLHSYQTRPAGAKASAPAQRRPQSRERHAGFSLIELIVVIALAAVLLSLAAPGLGTARERGRESEAMVYLRQTHAGIAMYADDHDDFAPFMGTPHKPWEPVLVNGVRPRDSWYFAQKHYYVNLLFPAYAPRWEAIARDVRSKPPDFLFGRFWLAQGAFAEPRYWYEDDAPDDLLLYRGVPLRRITFPSSKGLLLDTDTGMYAHPARRTAPNHVLFAGLADGSARSYPEVPEMDANTVERPYGAAPWPVLATRRGFEGRDFR